MPTVLYHCAPRRAQRVPQPGPDRGMQRVLPVPRLLMQEVRAAQAYAHLGVIAETHDRSDGLTPPAAPALDEIGVLRHG